MTSNNYHRCIITVIVAVTYVGRIFCDGMTLRFEDENYVVREEKFSKVDVVVTWDQNSVQQTSSSIICKVSDLSQNFKNYFQDYLRLSIDLRLFEYSENMFCTFH